MTIPGSIPPEPRVRLSLGSFPTIPLVATMRVSPYQVMPLTLLIIALRTASASIDSLEQKRNAITKPDFRSDTAHLPTINRASMTKTHNTILTPTQHSQRR